MPKSRSFQGFDTKDTELSGPRLAWQKLQPTLTTSNRINFANHPPLNVSGTQAQNTSVAISRRSRRSWADQLLGAFSTVACYDAPIPLTFNDGAAEVILCNCVTSAPVTTNLSTQ
ncbi:hypothetical protein ANCDUO_24778 [Ancylostoma duodenale]|uniref:Uncharacterized protein n=1 Tax=Ancylostoma duodenale TaxID=51022 RepID=A0A0C2F9P7_9BILA|nr:hypothetical protein ANCDUO_24778 [Ancylostoma duodenale]